MTRRICSLWLPNLAIERWASLSGAPAEAAARPLVLTVEGRHGPLIHAVTLTARERGARVGSRLTDARALDPGLEAEAADVAGETAWLRAAARWASRWSPLVEDDGSDALRLDVSGVAHLFGGERALISDMEARFAAMGVSARAAIAPTAGAAWALARYEPEVRTATVDRLAQLLAPLPVSALRLSPLATQTLVRLGLKTVGDLAGVPRKALARRFPKDAHPLDALDRALGRRPEPLTPLPDDPPPRALLPIKEPVVHPEAGAQALNLLVPRLAAELERRKLGARHLFLTAFRVDGTTSEVQVSTSIPTREPGHLHRLLGGVLERVGLDPGFGIDAFLLEVRWWERLDSAQEALVGEPSGEMAVAALIDRLSVRLGPAKVRVPVAVESHLPERAAGWREGIDTPLAIAGKPVVADKRISSRRREGEQVPARLLDSPEAIAVIYATPEGLPRRFVWRRKVHDIARAQGPRRVAPEWWRSASTARLRDYYRVEDGEGRRFWIFREGLVDDGRGGAPCWFVHGLFD
ncbi:DNA polymerase Y family protein [Sphingomonas swuensis]|uniref:DNA polymerase Y family protein n=1 Tax=Sphingomonas swuensis TaxID=977800 RepID=A0ABP7TFF1_9SPHN